MYFGFGIWTIKGLNDGLFLILKILLTLDSAKAFPARPYTVSVGIAITFPFFNDSIARFISEVIINIIQILLIKYF